MMKSIFKFQCSILNDYGDNGINVLKNVITINSQKK